VTENELLEIARRIAQRKADRMVREYVESVRRHKDAYEAGPPDSEDFWVWIEGYNWGLE
jgi:cob(I)alamin adenosyltransferase